MGTGLLVGALLFAAAEAAEAVPDRWVLLAETDQAALSSAAVDESVRAAARFRLGLRFLSPEEAFVEGGLEAQSGLSSCGADAACVAERLRAARVDYALLLVVRRVAEENLIALRVVRAQTGEVAHSAVEQALDAAAATARLTSGAFEALAYIQGGELIVTTEPERAELSMSDGALERPVVAGRTMLLPAGSYRLRARLEGLDDEDTETRVTPGQTQRVTLVLTRQEGLTDNVWFWVGLGVVAVAAGVAVTAVAVGGDRCFCAAPDPSQCGSCP